MASLLHQPGIWQKLATCLKAAYNGVMTASARNLAEVGHLPQSCIQRRHHCISQELGRSWPLASELLTMTSSLQQPGTSQKLATCGAIADATGTLIPATDSAWLHTSLPPCGAASITAKLLALDLVGCGAKAATAAIPTLHKSSKSRTSCAGPADRTRHASSRSALVQERMEQQNLLSGPVFTTLHRWKQVLCSADNPAVLPVQ